MNLKQQAEARRGRHLPNGKRERVGACSQALRGREDMGMFKYGMMAMVGVIALISRGGNGDSGDVEKVVAASPDTVYAAVAMGMTDVPVQTMTGPDGSMTLVGISVDRSPDRLVQTVMVDGKPGIVTTYTFDPLSGGTSTRVIAEYKIDRAHIGQTNYAKGENKTATSGPQWENRIEENLARLELALEGGAVPRATTYDRSASPSMPLRVVETPPATASAVAPMSGGTSPGPVVPTMSARPMMDPSAVARANVGGGNAGVTP